MLCPGCKEKVEEGESQCAKCGETLLLADRFLLRNELGKGGSSTSYLAQNTQDERQVVLKILDVSLMADWKQMELFRRQFDLLKTLEHGGLPKVFSHFEVQIAQTPHLCLEQEWLEGENLRTQLANGKRFTEEEALLLLHQALDILGYLHGLSPPVIHRDIKPSNLLLSGDGKLTLIDFDTASGIERDPMRKDATMVGTAGFVPMEQLSGQSVPASDIYALGATMVALLSHREIVDLPVERGRLRFEDAVEISNVFQHTLKRMLAPVVEDRFQSVDEVRVALRATGAPEEIPTAVYEEIKGPVGRARRYTPEELESLGWKTDPCLSWPIAGRASTIYSSSYSASNIIGPPRVFPSHEDRPGVWSSLLGDRGQEWLQADFSMDSPASRAIRVFETQNPGAIEEVTITDDAKSKAVIYRQPASTLANRASVLEIDVIPPRTIKTVHILLDTATCPGWNQIDTVALVSEEPAHDGAVDWGYRRIRYKVYGVVAAILLAMAAWTILNP